MRWPLLPTIAQIWQRWLGERGHHRRRDGRDGDGSRLPDGFTSSYTLLPNDDSTGAVEDLTQEIWTISDRLLEQQRDLDHHSDLLKDHSDLLRDFLPNDDSTGTVEDLTQEIWKISDRLMEQQRDLGNHSDLLKDHSDLLRDLLNSHEEMTDRHFNLLQKQSQMLTECVATLAVQGEEIVRLSEAVKAHPPVAVRAASSLPRLSSQPTRLSRGPAPIPTTYTSESPDEAAMGKNKANGRPASRRGVHESKDGL